MKRGWLLALATIILAGGMVSTSYAEVKLGGELRLRGVAVKNEERTTAGFKSGGFFEQRTRVNADASVDENAKVFVQVQDSRQWGSEDPKGAAADQTIDTADNDNGGIDLSQGYVEIGKLFGQPLSVRLGRQAMAYGEHRLIGSLEWSNNARRFDALKFTYAHDAVDVDVFTAKISENTDATVGGNNFGDDSNLNGIYAMLKVVPKNAVDVYLLNKTVGATDTNFHTIGARVKGAVADVNVDYNAEFAVQTGDAMTDVDQQASAFAVRAGYTLPDVMGLRIGVEYDSATGDDDTTDDKAKTFDNLYPTNHYLYGFTDDVNWQNVNAISVNASLKPMDNLTVALEYWIYKANEEIDGEDDRGTEINLKLNHALSKNIACEAAYAMRDAGKTGASAYTSASYGAIPADESSSFGYFMINVKFM